MKKPGMYPKKTVPKKPQPVKKSGNKKCCG